MLAASIHGIVLAFGLILPLGIQNVFIFTQGAVHKRFIQVIPVVLTAALCDTFLISSAVLGVSALLYTVDWLQRVLVLSGGLFLIYMGLQLWRSASTGGEEVEERVTVTLRKRVTFTLMISIMNPHAILDTVGVIGTSSIPYSGMEKIMFAAACTAVSWIWFFALAIVGRAVGIHDRSGRFMLVVNKVSAVVMWAAAIHLLMALF